MQTIAFGPSAWNITLQVSKLGLKR